MHPNLDFHWEERAALRAFASEIGFGMVFAATPNGPRVAHVPLVWLDETRIGFHLARGNALVRHLSGSEVLVVVNGPDAYVSPDWYGLADQVPTWNYLSAEFQGEVATLDEAGLIAQVDAVSAQQEARLAPKPAWTRAKMRDGLFSQMLRGIIGFEVRVTGWRGTAKLGQNKPPEAREGVAKALDERGQRAMALLMRTQPHH